jgi:methyl-galactoside transport system substrate-binding protein
MGGKVIKMLAIAMLLGGMLCGCTGQQDGRPVIGILAHDLNDPESQTYTRHLQAQIDSGKFRAEVLDARNDQSRQEEQLDTLLRSGCAGVVISPVITAAADRITAKLTENGVPAVFLSRKPPDRLLSGGGKLAYVGCDPAQQGTCQGGQLLSLPDKGDLNGDGVVSYVLLQGPASRSGNALQAASTVQTLQLGGVTPRELDAFEDLKTREAGKMVCAGMLSRYAGVLDVILCSEDEIVLGALDALDAAGLQAGEDVYLLGTGGSPETAELAQEGRLTGTVCCDLAGQAARAVQVLERLIRGEKVENLHFLDHIPVGCGENREP